MAFAFMNVFEPSIVKSIYDYALIEPTEAHVIFFNHITVPEEEYHITLPNERATIRELREAMSELHRFKRWNWFPDEFHFFEEGGDQDAAEELDPDEYIYEYGLLRLRLWQTLRWDSESSSHDSDSD